MKRAPLVIFILIGLLAAPARAAAPQQISTDFASRFSAAGGYVSWEAENPINGLVTPRLWDGAVVMSLRRMPGNYFSLGTDSRGRAALAYWRCRRTTPQCALLQRDLRTGATRVLLRQNAHFGALAASAGAVAFTRNPRQAEKPASGSGLYVRPRGARRARRYSADQPHIIDVGGGQVVYEAYRPSGENSFDTVIRVLDLKTRRSLLIADVSDFAADCRCTSWLTSVDSPQIDGHFVYWLTTISPGDSLPGRPRTEIDRLDLRSPASPVLAYRLDRGASFFTVSGGTIYFGSGLPHTPTGGVYRVPNPDWGPAMISLPVK